MKHLTEQWWSWCGDNDLSLSVNKTQELIVDTTKDEHAPLQIKSLTVERVSITKFLVVYIREALLWNSTPHAWPRRLGRGCTYLRCWSHTHTRSHTHIYIYIHNPHHFLLKYYWEHPDELHGDWHEDFAVCGEDGWRGQQDLTWKPVSRINARRKLSASWETPQRPLKDRLISCHPVGDIPPLNHKQPTCAIASFRSL